MTAIPPNELRVLRVMWIAFLVAIGLYAPMPYLLGAEGLDPAAALPAGAQSGLHFAALGAAVSSFAARRWWTNSLLAALGSGATPARADVWARLRAGCVVTWALSESVALLGLALAMIARRPLDGLPFAAAAAVLLYLHRPAVWPLEALTAAAT